MGKKSIITYISMISEILRYKLIKQRKQKPDVNNIKKEVNAIEENYPLITSYISLLLLSLHELADNTDIGLDYFEINLNNYLMFKNIDTLAKVEPPLRKNKTTKRKKSSSSVGPSARGNYATATRLPKTVCYTVVICGSMALIRSASLETRNCSGPMPACACL